MTILLGGLIYLPKLPAGRTRAIMQLALLAILPVDALTHNPKMFPVLPASFLAGDAWTAGGNPPAPKPGEGRLMISPEAEQRLSYSLVKNTELDFTSKRLGEWYNLNLLDRIPKVSGASLLRPAHFDIIQKYAYFTDGSHIGEGLLDFMSVAWISSPQDPVRWSSRTNHLPMVTGGQRPSFASDEQTLAAICADSFDPRQTVYLPESERALVNAARTTDFRVSDVRFTGRRIDMTVVAPDTSLVVISQSFYHLWRAFVDGSPARLLRANLAFQAVEVPAGNHHVKVVYDDPNFRIGVVVSLASLAVCGLIWFRISRRILKAEKMPEDTAP
jgi:hypothetical protein